MSPLSPTAPADPPLLLVVEDSKYDRMILTEAFREAELNLSLRFVIHGEDLLDYLRCRNAYAMPHAGSSPAVILMDLNMPRMNGLDALKEIRADVRLRMLPVVILSTSDDAMQITRAYALGVNAFMTKPSRFEDIVDLLRRFGAFWLECAGLPKPSVF